MACEWKTSRASVSSVTMNGKNARNPYAATAKANVCTSALVRNLAPGMACRVNRLNFHVAGLVAMSSSQYAGLGRKPEVSLQRTPINEGHPEPEQRDGESRDLHFN